MNLLFSKEFYVDPRRGSDLNSGSLQTPFQTLDHALLKVAGRIEKGILSDKIFLRGGVYRKSSYTTLWFLKLKGTKDDLAVLSAMPAESNAEGAVQRKSGLWYENVVFDDGYLINSAWKRCLENSAIWRTQPKFSTQEWIHQNLWPWTRTETGFPLTNEDDTGDTTKFTVAPYMILQDGEPLYWVDSLDEMREGTKTYDHGTGTLYVWPFDYRDPNHCKMESWYGGPEEFEAGTLYLDGEGRAIFDGNLEFAVIRGFEFRMFTRLFELHRRKYHFESDRVNQHFVYFEDNLCRYGWINILLDCNSVNETSELLILPEYDDRSNWVVRNNIFYRPSREVFQMHGDNHVFEHNVIIDHIGPWAGPAACVGAVNTRNTRNFIARYNYISGQGNNKWHHGSIFPIETGATHADSNGDYIYGGQSYIGNLITDITTGNGFVLGKGGTRVRDVMLQGNIFYYSEEAGNAIRMASPHENLRIENNLFIEQASCLVVDEPNQENLLGFSDLPNTIVILNNLFLNNRGKLDVQLLEPSKEDFIEWAGNIYSGNDPCFNPKVSLNTDIKIVDAKSYDFRVIQNNGEIQYWWDSENYPDWRALKQLYGSSVGLIDYERPLPRDPWNK